VADPKSTRLPRQSAPKPVTICCRRCASGTEGPRKTRSSEFSMSLSRSPAITAGTSSDCSRRGRRPRVVRSEMCRVRRRGAPGCPRAVGGVRPCLWQTTQAARAHSGRCPSAPRTRDAGADRPRTCAVHQPGDARPIVAPTRSAVSGQRARPRTMPAVQRSVSVRTFADWEEPLPGEMEPDLVSHGAGRRPGASSTRSP